MVSKNGSEMDDNWLHDDVDLLGHALGVPSDSGANVDGGGPTQYFDPEQSIGNGSYAVQQANSYSYPVCPSGGECPAVMFWRQRCEQSMAESNHRIMTTNNYMAEVNRLSSRLTQAEKSMRMYQQRLVDAFNSAEPVKKELDDIKNQLLVEVRERNKYQCEAESVKAAAAQLKAFIIDHEEKAAALRDQVVQLQVREAEKAVEVRKSQEKIAALEAKYEKAKETVKKLRDESARYRRYAENAGMGHRVTRRAAQTTASRQHSSCESSSDDGDEHQHDDSDLMAEQLETEMMRNAEVGESATLVREKHRPPAPVAARTRRISRDQGQPVVHSKAMAVLERKEREEATGTYIGNKKRPFGVTGSRSGPRTKVNSMPDSHAAKKSRNSNSNGATGRSMVQSADAIGQMTPEDMLASVFDALKYIREGPLSPIPDIPEILPITAELEQQNSIVEPSLYGKSTNGPDMGEQSALPSGEAAIINTEIPSIDAIGLSPPPSDISGANIPLLEQRPHILRDVENTATGTPMEVATGTCEVPTPTISVPDSTNGQEVVLNSSFASADESRNLVIVLSGDDESQSIPFMEIMAAATPATIRDVGSVEIAINEIVAPPPEQSGADKDQNGICPTIFDDNRMELEQPPILSPPYYGGGLIISEEIGNDMPALAETGSEGAGSTTTSVSKKKRAHETIVTTESTPDEEPPKRKRGRPRLHPPKQKTPLAIPVGKTPPAAMPAKAKPGRPPIWKEVASRASEMENACEPFWSKIKDNRSYTSILDSMLTSGDSARAHVSALAKWLTKPKLPAEAVACSFVDAIKRHSSMSWIAAAHVSIVQWESTKATRLLQQNILNKSAPVGRQALSINDTKLANLLDGLLEADNAEWKKTPDLMISLIKWKMSSTSSQEMSAGLREVLCRWAIYLCQRRPTRNKLDVVKEVLLIMIRRNDLGEMSQSIDQGTLNVFLTLALVWPAAFKKLIVGAQSESERLLQAVFRYLLCKSSSKSKVERLLDHCVGRQQWEAILGEQPSFNLLIREQLAKLSRFSAEFEIGERGIRQPDEFVNCVNSLRLIAPYCDEQLINSFVESPLQSVGEWHAIGPEDALARGGTSKLIADIFLILNMASSYPKNVATRLKEIMRSLKLIILSIEDVQNPITGKDRALLICASIELFTSLPSSAMFGKMAKVEKLLEQLIEALKKEKSVDDSVCKFYQKFLAEFGRRRLIK